MRKATVWLLAFIEEDQGLTIVEYAIAAGLITATLAAAMLAMGVSIDGVMTTLINFMTA